jgi:acyl-CoA thioester hydrolase
MIEETAGAGATVTYRGVVYPWHCDHMGHMNVMWYVGRFDEATWASQ